MTPHSRRQGGENITMTPISQLCTTCGSSYQSSHSILCLPCMLRPPPQPIVRQAKAEQAVVVAVNTAAPIDSSPFLAVSKDESVTVSQDKRTLNRPTATPCPLCKAMVFDFDFADHTEIRHPEVFANLRRIEKTLVPTTPWINIFGGGAPGSGKRS